VNCRPNLKSVALPVPDIIEIGVFGGVANPNLGEEEAVWGRDGTVRKRVGEFYRASLVGNSKNLGRRLQLLRDSSTRPADLPLLCPWSPCECRYYFRTPKPL